MSYQPPFTLTSDIVSLVADIAEKIGRLSAKPDFDMSLRLRRINRIRTITGSLAIEGNTLTEEQITAILDGKMVLAPPREVQEARNALAVYEGLSEWNGLKEADLLTAHQQLMLGLLDYPGAYRQGGVGVMAGDKVLHMAPPASRVPVLMTQLFDWLRTSPEHPLIASSIFHYEFEFIHPFEDGNGRMGRLWQTLLLSRWQPAFAWLPVESLVHQQQAAYYKALSDSTATTDCAPFIRFMLGCIHEAVNRVVERTETPVQMPVETPVKKLKTPGRILLLLQKQPELTLAEVAQAIGLSLSAVERAAMKLQQEGKLRHHGAKKKGIWEVTE
ncbi:MAG: Fic family protein [Pseudomonadota bacterium]